MERARKHFPAHQPLRTCALTPDTRVLWLQNKDGLVDIVAVSSVSNNITWYANRGGSMPSWTSNTLGGASPLTAPMGVTVSDSTCIVVLVQGCKGEEWKSAARDIGFGLRLQGCAQQD